FLGRGQVACLIARGARLLLVEPIGELLIRHDVDRDRHEGMIAPAELRALAVNMPVRSALNQVRCNLPGTASVLMPKDGTAKSWITSFAFTCTTTFLFTGTTNSWSTVRSRGRPGFKSASGTMIEAKVMP